MATIDGSSGSQTNKSWRVVIERFPVRKTILGILSIAIIYGVVVGTTKTLALGLFDAHDWISFTIQGLARGAVYALIALGYTMVYGILLIINFAHGEVFMAGAYTAFFVAMGLHGQGFLNAQPVLSMLILFAVSAAVSTAVALVLEKVAYRPLRGKPRLVPLHHGYRSISLSPIHVPGLLRR